MEDSFFEFMSERFKYCSCLQFRMMNSKGQRHLFSDLFSWIYKVISVFLQPLRAFKMDRRPSFRLFLEMFNSSRYDYVLKNKQSGPTDSSSIKLSLSSRVCSCIPSDLERCLPSISHPLFPREQLFIYSSFSLEPRVMKKSLSECARIGPIQL